MPKTNTPYNPQPERDDAFGELANKGFEAVPGDHAARLQSIQDRLSLPTESAPTTEAVVRNMRPQRWLAIAAGIAALLVAGITLYNYDSPEQQTAKVMAPVDVTVQEVEQAPIAKVPEALDAAPVVSAPPRNEAKNEAASKRAQRAEKEINQRDINQEELASNANSTTDTVAPPKTAGVEKRMEKAAPMQVDAADAPIADVELPELEESEPVPPAAKSAIESKQASEKDADMLADDAATVDVSTSSYRMERAPAKKTREVTGEVVEPSGVPVVGARITIEETGQQVVTDQKGEFSILVSDDAVVGDIQAEGFSSFLFDVTAGEEYRIFLPRVSSSLPTAQLKGKDVGLRIVAPKAEAYAAFDAYVATKQSEFSGERVVVQFDVNRYGRPRQIMSGPGKQNREAVKEVKEWLKNGPDWPAAYQRKSWRYIISLP